MLGQSRKIICCHSEPYTPFFAIVFIFILICNLIGLIPGFESPTGVPIVLWVAPSAHFCTTGIRRALNTLD